MLRLIIAIVLLALLPIASAQNAQTARYVNLNAPGAMEKVRAANPGHYQKIQGIIEGLTKQSHDQAARWIQTSFGASEVLYTNILLTSEPPQKDIAFTLDSTRYHGRITLRRERAEFFPVKSN